jgi:hypothetical protein
MIIELGQARELIFNKIFFRYLFGKQCLKDREAGGLLAQVCELRR